jgi:hypothetical protein
MISNRISQLVQQMTGALVCAGALLAAGGAVAQDEVSIVAQPPAHHGNQQDVAITSCVTAFINELFPGRHEAIQTVAVPDHDAIRHPSRLSVSMEVALQAALRSTGQLVAQSQCTVSRGTQVKALRTQIKEVALLASVVPRDLSVKLVSR